MTQFSTFTEKQLEAIKKLDDCSQREVFADLESSLPYVSRVISAIAGSDIAINIYGHTLGADGSLTPIEGMEWPTDSEGNPFACIVARLNRKEETKDGNKQVPKAVLVHPVPTLDQLLAVAVGREMVESVIEKELNHRMVRPVRTADKIEKVIGEMPVSLESYATSGREATGGLLASFNEHYKVVLDYMKETAERVKRARLTKDELKKSCENAAYATHYYPALEEAGDFVLFIAAIKSIAEEAGDNVSLFESWAAERDNETYEPEDSEEEDGGQLDLKSLLSGLKSKGADSDAKAESK